MELFSETQLKLMQIWKSSLRIYQKTFFQTWGLGWIIGVIFSASAILNTIYKPIAGEINLNIKYALIHLTASMIIVYLSSMILLKIYNRDSGQTTPPKDIAKIAIKKYLKVAISLLIAFAIPLILTPSVLVIPFIPTLIFFVISYIFTSVLFVAVQPLVLLDNYGIFTSIKKSCQLIWGNWWRAFAIIFPLMFIKYWLAFAISYAYINKSWCIIGTHTLFATLFFPLFYICILVIFNDAKIRKNK